MSKKIILKKDTTPCEILKSLKENWQQNSDLCIVTGASKQKVNYWLGKLMKEGLVSRFPGGIYEITWSGKNLLNTYELEKSKEKICLENMRYKFPIHEGLEKLTQAVWLKMNDMNHMQVYRGTFEGFTTTVYAGSKNPSLEITCPKRFGVDIYEMMYFARNDVEVIAKGIVRENHVKLGMCEPSMKPEWAIPSPIAEVILDKTCSSQIRTPNGVINRSKGRNADVETRDIHLAHKFLMMPDEVVKMRRELSELKPIILKIAQVGNCLEK